MGRGGGGLVWARPSQASRTFYSLLCGAYMAGEGAPILAPICVCSQCVLLGKMSGSTWHQSFTIILVWGSLLFFSYTIGWWFRNDNILSPPSNIVEGWEQTPSYSPPPAIGWYWRTNNILSPLSTIVDGWGQTPYCSQPPTIGWYWRTINILSLLSIHCWWLRTNAILFSTTYHWLILEDHHHSILLLKPLVPLVDGSRLTPPLLLTYHWLMVEDHHHSILLPQPLVDAWEKTPSYSPPSTIGSGPKQYLLFYSYFHWLMVEDHHHFILLLQPLADGWETTPSYSPPPTIGWWLRTNTILLYLKKLTCKRISRQVFICLRPRTPYPPPLHTVYVYTVQCTYSHKEGGRGGSWTREKGRGGTVHKDGSKLPTWLPVSPVYKL